MKKIKEEGLYIGFKIDEPVSFDPFVNNADEDFHTTVIGKVGKGMGFTNKINLKEIEEIELMFEIAERAEDMNLLIVDRISLIMDLECVNKEFDLRLKELLNADDFNFSHDICGIQKNLNRKTKELENFFVPRFSR